MKRFWSFVMILALLVPGFTGAQEKAKPVDEKERIKFEQDKAQAHMKELEERMFELSKLIRDTQPDDAARLLMGVQKAREHLIAERMGDAATLLNELKLDQATSEQKDVIAKLEDLKKLLLTADIGLELKLKQLKDLKNARAMLAKLVESENQQMKATKDELMKEGAQASDFKNLQPSEQRNQRQADDLEQLIKNFGTLTGGAANAVGLLSRISSEQTAKSPSASSNWRVRFPSITWNWTSPGPKNFIAQPNWQPCNCPSKASSCSASPTPDWI